MAPHPAGTLLFVGDIHYASGRHTPEGRSPEYPEQVLAKLQFVAAQAREHQASLCFLGDFLHAKHPSWLDVVTMTTYLDSIRDIKVFAIAGNHDAANVQQACAASPFAMWCTQGLVHHLDPKGHGYAKEDRHGIPNVVLTGASYHTGYSDDSQSFSPVLPLKSKEMVFHLSHGVLWLRDETPPFPHYRPKIKFPFHGLCVNGDLHAPTMRRFEPDRVGPRGYVNLGSLVRTSRARVQASHKPYLLLVRVEEGAYTIEWVPVPHETPASVFVATTVKPAASSDEIRAFAEDLLAADGVDAYGTTEALLASVVRQGGYGQEVHDRARRLIEAASRQEK